MYRLSLIPRDRNHDYSPSIIQQRLRLCEEQAGHTLQHLGGQSVDASSAKGNIENLIGFAQIPVGIAGPYAIDTTDGIHEVYVPMATTEGALVASHSRGMRMINAGDGVKSRVTAEGLSQHPIFCYAGHSQANIAAKLVHERREELGQIVAGCTHHGRLEKIETQLIGRRMILRLLFFTADAIGINMAAKATDACMRSVAEWTGALECYVHGQDVEKRANARALVEGRGRSVIAEATIDRATLRDLGRTTPEAMVALSRSYATGFAQMGTHNWMVQSANGLAAIFTACGQDIAYITECATGFLDLELDVDGNLYAAATLPSLLVGTVGGGSMQGTALECLEILGCAGSGKANRFAEIIAATVLAGDISLIAAFSSSEFVSAHEQLGRNRPDSSQ